MSKSMKNREGLLPLGTRVIPAYAKFDITEGTVIGHSEDNKQMLIQWDDQPYPSGYFTIPEVRRAD